MKMMRGDMLDVIEQSHMFVISTNGIIKKDGSLVMGKGIAGQVSEKYPNISKMAGDAIQAGNFPKTYESNWKHDGFSHRYKFIQVPGTAICLLQVKNAWWDGAKMFLLHQSVLEMRTAIDMFTKRHGSNPIVHMNFPGIGNGGLSRAVVLPRLKQALPDFVHVWEHANIEERV